MGENRSNSTLCIISLYFHNNLEGAVNWRWYQHVGLSQSLVGWRWGQRKSRSGPSLEIRSLYLCPLWVCGCQFKKESPIFRARNKADITEFQTFLKSDLQMAVGNSLAVQWLRLCASSVQIPSQQTKFPCVMGCGKKKKKKRLVVGLREAGGNVKHNL